MTYYQVAPSPALAQYVRFFWILEGELAAGTSYIHRSMADGSAEMIFHYKGLFDTLVGPNPSSVRSGIDGQSNRFRRYQVNESFGIFGAYLYPFAVPALLGHSAAALTNQMPDLHTLLAQAGRDLEEQIMTADSNQLRVTILSAFLLDRLLKKQQPAPAIFSSISYIIQTRGMVDVNTLAGQYYLSTRQFERNFKEFAGFSPKLYSRIIRFQSAIAQYGHTGKSLTDIAYDCGYYDQSHFIHDFKEFSGLHPRHYFTGKAEGTAWKEDRTDQTK